MTSPALREPSPQESFTNRDADDTNKTIVDINANMDGHIQTIDDAIQTIVDINANVDGHNRTIVDINARLDGHNAKIVGQTQRRAANLNGVVLAPKTRFPTLPFPRSGGVATYFP